MLEITRTAINKNGHEIVGDYTYNLSISIEENILSSISCQISKKCLVDMQAPVGSQPQKVEQVIQVGVIQLANNQVSTQISSDEDSITHLMKFSEYMKEIQSGLQELKTTKK